ncbi:hypothetical protein [Bradyrhizobium brasilense]|nr:hypothetical protein [Bradyrhizobium brasilense]
MDLTADEVADIEAKMEAGSSISDLGLGFAKGMGFETYRKENPGWSGRIEALSVINADKKKAAGMARGRQTRTHCRQGHELTPETFARA